MECEIRGDAFDAYWMPFTPNATFKAAPRVVVGASGHHYIASDGRRLYDTFSGLWTTGLGHCHPKISEAVSRQISTLDYAMAFNVGNDKAALLASRLGSMTPAGLNRVFFTNSGSESADTSLKIALAYHRARGAAQRTRLIGRERGYHGVNFGGMSVGGMGANRRAFSANLVAGVDHLRATYNAEHTATTRGRPEWGAHLADDLERMCALHGADTIAAVIVEPVAGSTGVLPPPRGYLERLRELCNKHGILLIFDEVITAFGRVGSAFAFDRFEVMPDMINIAKGLTNGAIPMGAVLAKQEIYDAICAEPAAVPELFHGYTYSGHPVAAAAGLAALEIYVEEGAFKQARALEPVFEEAIHSLRDHPRVRDVRSIGLMGAVDLEPSDSPGARGLDVHQRCFWDEDLVVRNGGDCLQFSPFLTSKPEDISMTFERVSRVLDGLN